MDPTTWFRTHLQASADGFAWAVEQMPRERLFSVPPQDPDGAWPLGSWSAARQVFHMAYYEREAVLPHMQIWLGGPPATFEGYDDQAAWDANRDHDLPALLAAFQRGRSEQIAMLERYQPHDWDVRRESGWGQVTLRWIVSKTYQHTNEHTSNVARMALFWDNFVAYFQEKRRGREIAQ